MSSVSNEIMYNLSSKSYYLTYLYNLVMNKVKDQINKRGSKLPILGKTFRAFHSYDGNKKISKEDFIFSFKELGIILENEEFEVRLLFSLLFITFFHFL